MLRVQQDLIDRAGLDDPARVHDRQSLDGLGHHCEVVGDQQ
jgi:hypothetical protein